METAIHLVTRWEPPEEDDVRILGMPNVPRPLHGEGCQPRTFYGKTVWDYMRKKCYVANGWKCCVCGAEGGVDIPQREINAHELFYIDYAKGESEFKRCVCVCATCHAFIHSGRLLTLYKQRDRYTPKSKVLKVIESGLSRISVWNNLHPDEPEIEVYSTIASALEIPSLANDVRDLLEKYPVVFYKEDTDKVAAWKKWHVVIGTRTVYTPYDSYDDWAEKMEAKNGKDRLVSLAKRGKVDLPIPQPKLTAEDYADLEEF